MSGDWIQAAAIADLAEGGRKLVRHHDKRIALFRTSLGVYAVDNRCPHEGYALLQGDVKEGVLTCDWHNWKFALDEDLGIGTCLYGGESVRSYPVDVRNGDVWIDVTDPEAEEIAPQLFASLLDAMGDVDVGRMARDTMRLQGIGTPLAEVVREGVRYGAPRVEYGWNHSLATMADCLNLAALFDGPLESLSVVQGLSVVSETQVRRPLRPRPEPADVIAVYGSIDSALRAYPGLVDDEQQVEAEALIRGAIAVGADPADIRHALLSGITDHFLGYGHPMIYTQKAFEMLDRIGWEEADTLLGPLVPATVLSTKYGRLPYMRKFLRAWNEADVDMSALLANQNGATFGEEEFRRSALDGGPSEAFGALHNALVSGVAVPKLIDSTSRAAADRLSRFDIDLDADDTNEWGWLDVTHTLTYFDALRWAWSVDPSPEVLRGLFHAVWFVQWTQQFDQKDPGPAPRPIASNSAAVLKAIRSKDPEAAVATIHGFEGPESELHAALAQGAAEDNAVAPIMVAHTVKTTRAAIVESGELGDRTPLAAAGRFLASPKRERWVYSSTLDAIDFVSGRAKGDDS